MKAGFPFFKRQQATMQIVLQDLPFSFRRIIRNPGFSFTAILSLTLGIGAAVAVYSTLFDAVFHPWPYAGIGGWLTDNAGHEGTWGLTGPRCVRAGRSLGRYERGNRNRCGLSLELECEPADRPLIESGTRDPWMMLAVSVILVGVAALACLIPARRATAIDPMAALRCE